ncbi:MAG: NADP-specific glutamate dehydrogenase [Firmicutes bacterium]|nr:NADP-specific glutamate dehydrogenase [Bacillota bacterium]
MSYALDVLKQVKAKHASQPEFVQAVEEVLNTLTPTIVANESTYRQNAILERMVEPDRSIIFRVPWVDDKGQAHVNIGYRVQYNNALGPYKGGNRFHPSVTLSVMKFLGFEQGFKNALTGLPMGGGKGGADFDPKGKSEQEIARFCQSFMMELFRHVSADIDVPAGDIGVSAKEIGYMYGTYKRITRLPEGWVTGKGLDYGGSLVRKQATGWGLVYLTQAMLQEQGTCFKGKTVVVSGSGNVALYAARKATEYGGKVVAMSDSNGWIYDKNGVDLDLVEDLKEVKKLRISEYVKTHKSAEYHESTSMDKDLRLWSVKCDIALPCATQNDIHLLHAKELIKNGVLAVAEGANMPTKNDACDAFLATKKVLFAPGKAANAGGVATSGLEMTQNAMRLSWPAEEVNEKLHTIMLNIYKNMSTTAKNYGDKLNFILGANIAGFEKLARAMLAHGVQ